MIEIKLIFQSVISYLRDQTGIKKNVIVFKAEAYPSLNHYSNGIVSKSSLINAIIKFGFSIH